MFRYNSDARLYVGRLSSQTSPRDLEILFGRYGRVCGVDRKRDYAFVEFSDRRYADEARYHLDGSMVDGCRIAVEFTKEFQVGKDSRPPHSGHCFNCGVVGHWARDCKAEDWTNSCYRCREEGHFMRDCKNSPKELRREPKRHSRSLSPRGGRRRRSYSRSRTPLKGDPRPDRDTRLSRSRRSPFPKARNPSVTPDETSTRYDAGDRIGSPVYGLVDTNARIQDGDCSPINGNTDHDGSLPGDGTESPVYGLVDTRGHIQDDDFSPINGNKDHNALPRKQ